MYIFRDPETPDTDSEKHTIFDTFLNTEILKPLGRLMDAALIS
jgi:hypothetical protein